MIKSKLERDWEALTPQERLERCGDANAPPSAKLTRETRFFDDGQAQINLTREYYAAREMEPGKWVDGRMTISFATSPNHPLGEHHWWVVLWEGLWGDREKPQ